VRFRARVALAVAGCVSVPIVGPCSLTPVAQQTSRARKKKKRHNFRSSRPVRAYGKPNHIVTGFLARRPPPSSTINGEGVPHAHAISTGIPPGPLVLQAGPFVQTQFRPLHGAQRGRQESASAQACATAGRTVVVYVNISARLSGHGPYAVPSSSYLFGVPVDFGLEKRRAVRWRISRRRLFATHAGPFSRHYELLNRVLLSIPTTAPGADPVVRGPAATTTSLIMACWTPDRARPRLAGPGASRPAFPGRHKK